MCLDRGITFLLILTMLITVIEVSSSDINDSSAGAKDVKK